MPTFSGFSHSRLLLVMALVLTTSPRALGQATNWFVDSLGQANQNLAVLVPELRRYASSHTVRDVIGSLDAIQRESDALVAQTRRGEPYEAVAAAYEQLDTRWRDTSFRLRASGELSPSVTNLVGQIDEIFRQIDRRLGIDPPIDRVRLRDLMIVTLTYMDAMFDDIRLAQGFSPQSEALLNQGRLLRERLRQESYRMETAKFNDILGSFTEFVQAWRGYAQSLHQLNDPHVHRRLESIRRQGEEVYATLRIQPAPDRTELVHIAGRLPEQLNGLAEQVGRWGAAQLTRDQFRFIETCRALAERARRLASEIQRSGPSAAAQQQFAEMDRTWNEGLRLMASVDPRSGLQGSLAQVNTHFKALRDLLGTGSWRSQAELLKVAVTLEASAELFNGDVQRMKRLIEPAAFSQSLAMASENFYRTAQQLHRQAGQGTEERAMVATATRLEQQFQQLTTLVNQLPGRGLTTPRVELIFSSYRELQPVVAQAAAMLVN